MDRPDIASAAKILTDLVRSLESGDPAIAVKAVRGLEQLGPLAGYAVPSLARALRDGGGVMRSEIIDALVAIGPAAREAGPELFQLVKGPDKPMRHIASTALISIFEINNIDINKLIGYDDYESFIKNHGIRFPLRRTPEDERQEHLDAAIATVPKDAPYEEQARQHESLRHAFNQKFAASQGEALKVEMLRRGENSKTYDNKLDLVRWANGELRRFNLAFSTAKTGIAILAVDRGVVEGRFTLKGKVKDEDGKTPYFQTKDAAELIEKLAVVDAPARREGLAERIEREAETPARNRRGR